MILELEGYDLIWMRVGYRNGHASSICEPNVWTPEPESVSEPSEEQYTGWRLAEMEIMAQRRGSLYVSPSASPNHTKINSSCIFQNYFSIPRFLNSKWMSSP